MISKKIISFGLALMLAMNLFVSFAITGYAASHIINLVTGDLTVADMTTIPAGFEGHRQNPATLSLEDGALKIVGSSANSAINTGISLTNGHTYVLEARIKSGIGYGSQVIDIISASSISLAATNIVSETINESWTTVRKEITVTANSKKLKFVPQSDEITWYIDELEIYDITNAKEISVPSNVKISSGAVEYDSKWYANPDTTVKFTSAIQGTTFSTVAVTDEENQGVSVSSSGDEYSFTMPNSNTAIAVTEGMAAFEFVSWSLEGNESDVETNTLSLWIKFNLAVEDTTLSEVEVTHNHPTADVPAVRIDIDPQDATKINVTFNESILLEETTYTINFADLECENDGVKPQETTSVSFTTSSYPSMTFESTIDGQTNVARDIGTVIIASSQSLDSITVNENNITISPAVAQYNVAKTGDKEITVTFDELAANTPYTISVSDSVRSSIAYITDVVPNSFAFETGEYPDANIISTSITDGATGVTAYTSSVVITYDNDLDTATVNNTSVTVAPEIDYTASAIGKVITVSFNETLTNNTVYEVTVLPTVKAAHGVTAETTVISFTTGAAFENIIKNPGFDTDIIDLDDAQDMTLVNIVELNDERVLKWKPSWESAPLYIGTTILPGHKYFMSMDVKSDTAHTVAWQANYRREGDSSNWKPAQSTTTLSANDDFVTISAVYTIPSTGIPEEGVSGKFRLYTVASGGTVWVDNVKLYDITNIPAGIPSVLTVTPGNNAINISPLTEEIVITFDKPMNPATFKGISINNGATIVSRRTDNSLSKCILKVSGINENTTYTVSVPATIKSVHAEAVTETSSNFTTGGYPTAGFVSSTIDNNETNVSPYTTGMEIEYDCDLDISTVNNESVTVSPAIDYTATATGKKIKIVFNELLLPTSQYTVSVTNVVKTTYEKDAETKTIKFTTGQYMPANFVSSTIDNNEANVSPYTSGIEFEYDANLDVTTVNNASITVSPAIDYTASATGKKIKVVFNEQLLPYTEYTVSVTDKVKTEQAMEVEAASIKFTTGAGFENIVENPGFDTDVIDLDDAQDMTLVNIVELNGERVLRWKPSWDSAPLYIGTTILPGHKYFMSMDVKSDTAHTVAWQANYQREGDSSNWKSAQSETILVENEDFVTVSAVHTVPSTGIPEEGVSGRFRLYTSKSGGTVWVDNVKLYDMTLAPAGTPIVTKTIPTNGATDISPFTDEIKITFDNPIDPTTIDGISVDNEATVISKKMNNSFTECTIKVGGLLVNKTYTINIPSSVKSMRGVAVIESSSTFSTWVVNTASFGQAVKGIENMDADGKLDTGIIHIVFPEYVDKTTVISDNFTVSYSVDGGNAVLVAPTEIIKGDKDVKLILPQSAVKNDATYTVTLSPNIKSMAGVAISSGDIVFTSKEVETIVANFTSITNETEAQRFMETDYKDLLQKNNLYDSIVLGNNEAVKNAIYADLANNTSTTKRDIVEEINNAIVVAMANNSGTDAEVKELILSDALGLNNAETDGTNIINVYNNTLTATKRAVFDTLINNKVFSSSTAEGVKNEIAIELILFTVKDSESWEPIQQTIENSKAYFGTNKADVTTIVSNTQSRGLQASVYRPLQGYVATSLAELYSALSKYYQAAISTVNTQQSQGGGGGGGGGSFGPAAITNTNLAQNEMQDNMATTVFKDLGNHSWAIKAIENLYSRGIISGKGDKTYAPGEDVTRNEFVKMMVATVGNYDSGATVEFKDLPSTHWSYLYVASAVTTGLVKGIGDGLFGTDKRMSRQDVAVLIYNAIKDKNVVVKATADFKDIDKASEYARDAVRFLRQIGVVNGDEKGNFNPQSALTRAEAAVILNAVLAYFE